MEEIKINEINIKPYENSDANPYGGGLCGFGCSVGGICGLGCS